MHQYGVYFAWAQAVFRRFVKAVKFNWLMTCSQAGKTIFRRKTVPDAQRQRGQLINQSRQRHARDNATKISFLKFAAAIASIFHAASDLSLLPRSPFSQRASAACARSSVARQAAAVEKGGLQKLFTKDGESLFRSCIDSMRS